MSVDAPTSDAVTSGRKINYPRDRKPRTLALTTPQPRPRCAVCRHIKRAQIEALLGSGMYIKDVTAELRKIGMPMKNETLGKHLRICLGGQRPLVDELSAQHIVEGIRDAKTGAEQDFATMVQARATALLRAGQMKVTANHGIAAQALLDRRAEKEADRNLALNLARLMSGAITPAPSVVIEGRVVEVPALPDGLAPDDIVEPR